MKRRKSSTPQALKTNLKFKIWSKTYLNLTLTSLRSKSKSKNPQPLPPTLLRNEGEANQYLMKMPRLRSERCPNVGFLRTSKKRSSERVLLSQVECLNLVLRGRRLGIWTQEGSPKRRSERMLMSRNNLLILWIKRLQSFLMRMLSLIERSWFQS